MRLLMYGCGVYNKFDKMSLFITRSCFYKEVEDESADDDSSKLDTISFLDQSSLPTEEESKFNDGSNCSSQEQNLRLSASNLHR